MGVHLHSSNRSNCVPTNFKWVNFKDPADDTPDEYKTLTSKAFTSQGHYPFCFNYDKGDFEFEREGRLPFNPGKFEEWWASQDPRDNSYGTFRDPGEASPVLGTGAGEGAVYSTLLLSQGV